MAKKQGLAEAYLHGFSEKEQKRLYRQARFLESTVFRAVDFSKQQKLIEVGCGVGAQTEILLERFPHLHISGVDASKAQIKAAEKHLAKPIHQGKVDLHLGDALNLPFKENSFDVAFICWFLEHVQAPIDILKDVKRVLKPGGSVFCNEVLNQTFFVHPYSPATLRYWFEFNDYQWEKKGDPFVGAKLANYLLEAGFQNVETYHPIQHYDNRAPKARAQFIEEWTSLLLSAAPELTKVKRVTQANVKEMTQELERLKSDPNAVIYYSWVQAKASVY